MAKSQNLKCRAKESGQAFVHRVRVEMRDSGWDFAQWVDHTGNLVALCRGCFGFGDSPMSVHVTSLPKVGCYNCGKGTPTTPARVPLHGAALAAAVNALDAIKAALPILEQRVATETDAHEAASALRVCREELEQAIARRKQANPSAVAYSVDRFVDGKWLPVAEWADEIRGMQEVDDLTRRGERARLVEMHFGRPARVIMQSVPKAVQS